MREDIRVGFDSLTPPPGGLVGLRRRIKEDRARRARGRRASAVTAAVVVIGAVGWAGWRGVPDPQCRIAGSPPRVDRRWPTPVPDGAAYPLRVRTGLDGHTAGGPPDGGGGVLPRGVHSGLAAAVPALACVHTPRHTCGTNCGST